MDPPPHSDPSSYTNFPILAFTILGILSIVILLLSYYLFINQCCLHFRRTDLHHFRINRRTETLGIHPPQSTEFRGLNPAAIRAIPTLRYVRASTLTPAECTVCLSEFLDRELLRVLPGCKHSFHVDCIDTWLQSSTKCPVCRFDISRVPLGSFPYPETERNASVVIAVTESNGGKSRRFWHVASKGDECIDIGRAKDERFMVQPIRRSFSMDSSNDRSLFLAVQGIVQQNQNIGCEASDGEGSSNDFGHRSASGRTRRSFFSFGRSSKSSVTVLPMQSEELC